MIFNKEDTIVYKRDFLYNFEEDNNEKNNIGFIDYDYNDLSKL